MFLSSIMNQSKLRTFCTASVLLLSSAKVGAQSLAFNQLSTGQADSIIKEFSANFTHSSVSGASTLGDIFGLQVGLMAGLTQSDEIKKLAESANSSADVNQLPHAGVLVLASVPLGFSFEASIVPKIGSEDFKFRNLGVAVKWTSDMLPVLLAVKAHMMKTDLDFKQTVSNVTSTVSFENQVSGVLLQASQKLGIIEPYAGIGFLRGKGSFDVSGTTSFFQSGVTTYSGNQTGSQIQLGAEINLLIFRMAFEYGRQFGLNTFNSKLAFSF